MNLQVVSHAEHALNVDIRSPSNQAEQCARTSLLFPRPSPVYEDLLALLAETCL